jgi:lipoprotein Spr
MKEVITLIVLSLVFSFNSFSQVQLQDSTTSLYSFLKEWWNVPYLWGGTTKKGIDCSAFVKTMYSSLHGKYLPRTSNEQYEYVEKISREEVKTGDLVFFKSGKRVNHVGYYLFDSLFVHSSSRNKRVIISSLSDSKYQKIWFSQGRIN